MARMRKLSPGASTDNATVGEVSVARKETPFHVNFHVYDDESTNADCNYGDVGENYNADSNRDDNDDNDRGGRVPNNLLGLQNIAIANLQAVAAAANL